MKSLVSIAVCVGLLAVASELLVGPAYAQRPDRGPDRGEGGWRGPSGERGERGGGRGGRGRGGRGRGGGAGGDDRRVDMVRQWDSNRDGYVTRDEVPERMTGFYDRIVDRAGLKGQRRVKVDDLVAGADRRRGGQNNQTDANPLDFGEGVEEAVAPGFGLNEDSGGSLYLASSEEERKEAIDSASDLMRRYDRNRSRILEREEWSQISGTPANADTNRDGKISHTELVNRLIVMRRSRTTSDKREETRKERASRDKSGRTGKSKESDDKSYRFTTAEDRIPKDARSWITGKDKDGDGQVSMAEFARSWSDSRVREFARYDSDGDGVVTPDEYLANK